MSTPLDKKLTELAAAALAAHGLTLVQAKLSGGSSGRGHLTLQVLAERPDGTGATLEECAIASRTLSAQLDVAEIINARYILEVGSPGLERPLLSPEDCIRFQGKNAKFQFADRQKLPGLKVELGSLSGHITAVENGSITLATPEGTAPVTFPFSLVRQAHLSPTAEELKDLMKNANSKQKE